MLRKRTAELLPSATVLVLKLHSCRTKRVAGGRGLGAERFEAFRRGLRLILELRALVRLCAIATATDYERTSALRIFNPEMQGRKSAHRNAHDVRLLNIES